MAKPAVIWKAVGRVGLLLAATTQGVHLRAWKSRYWTTNAPHMYQAARGMQILAQRIPGNSREWAVIQPMLPKGCGTLDNDANAHGNVLWNEEKWDPDNRQPLSYDPMVFNGGPMFRWWIRALEAHAQANQGLKRRGEEPDQDRWRRVDTVRSVESVYRYLGFMVHLAQDNCAPAHVANIRHAIWEGAEWFHWDQWTAGGGTGQLDQPQGVDTILSENPDAQGTSFWDVAQFHSYWGNDKKRAQPGDEYLPDSPHKGSGQWPNPLYQAIGNVLNKRVIQWNRDFLMRGLAEELKDSGYFKFFGDSNGRTLTEDDARQIRDAERGIVVAIDGLTCDGFPNALGTPDRFRQLLERQPQVLFPDRAPAGTLWLANRIWRISGDVEAPWKNLNQSRTPWLPNASYQGDAWDARWGSYGGHWGFPGRMPYELSSGEAIGEDLSPGNRGKARITPGDLYTWHVKSDAYSYAHDQGSGPTGFDRDERSLRTISSLPGQNGPIHALGMQLLNRAALATALVVEGFTRALPPLVERLTVVPRRPGARLESEEVANRTKVLPWVSPALGAYLDVSLAFNRADTPLGDPLGAPALSLEFFAVPRRLFQSGPDSFVKKIILTRTENNQLQGPGVLWPSDLQVNDRDREYGDLGTGQVPASPFASIQRDYDFHYSHLFGYPLRLRVGAMGAATNNLGNPAEGTFTGPWQIPQAEIAWEDRGAKEYQLHFNSSFEWTGEVEDPKYLFPEVVGSTPEIPLPETPTPTLEGIPNRKVLPSGDYVILVMAYRNGWRDAFARNQFKIMTPSKEVLEKGTWWSLPWTEANLATFRNAQAPPNPRRMIPDELAPIRVEGGQPTAVVQ